MLRALHGPPGRTRRQRRDRPDRQPRHFLRNLMRNTRLRRSALRSCRLPVGLLGLHAPAPARESHGPDARAVEHAPARIARLAAPLLAEWWRQLDDPLLVELIDAAAGRQPHRGQRRRAHRRGARLARGGRRGAGAQPQRQCRRPRAATRPVQRLRRACGGTGTHRQRFGAAASIPAITTLQAGLQSSWEIDLFGGLRASRDASQARLDGADAKWHERAGLGGGRDRQRLFRRARLPAPARRGRPPTRSRAPRPRA